MSQKLRDCQERAILEFEKYYYDNNDNDRGLISMCCGHMS